MDQIDVSRLQESIDRLVAAMDGGSGRISGASAQTASALRSLVGTFTGLKTAGDAVEDSMRKLERKQLAYEGLIANIVRGFINLSNSAISTTQSLAAASGAFNAASGGINMMFGTLQGFSRVVGEFAGNFPGYGRLIGTAATALAEAFGVVGRAIQFQLGAMQQQLDSYISLSKAGATFGGSLFYLQNAVVQTGVPMREFVALVSRSASDLSKMGITITGATQAVIQFTQRELMTDRALVGLYGGFNELAAATAQYMALQSQVGRMDYSNTANQSAAVKEYLRNVKILSDITGASAEQQAELQRRAQQNLLYAATVRQQIAAGFQDAGLNLNAVTTMFNRISPVLGEIAVGMVNGRDKLSAEQQRLLAQFPVLSNVIEQLTGAAKTMGAEEFREFMKMLLDRNKEALDQEAAVVENMFKDIYNRVEGPLKGIADIANAIRSEMNTFANIVRAFNEASKPGVGRTPEEIEGSRADAAAVNAAIQSAIQQMLEGQSKIDTKIAEQFVEMTRLVQLGFQIQDMAVTATSVIIQGSTGIINKITGAINTPDEPIVPANPATPALNQPTGYPEQPIMGTGGIATRPTTVAEDYKPEAVIPLAKGAVPMNIDWRPLTDILSQQVAQNDEMIRAMRDSRDAQEKLLYTLA